LHSFLHGLEDLPEQVGGIGRGLASLGPHGSSQRAGRDVSRLVDQGSIDLRRQLILLLDVCGEARLADRYSLAVLVSTDWLANNLADPDLVVVDMRWREDGSARTLYEQGHIPGATYLDWSTDLVDADSPVAFTLADSQQFGGVMEAHSIGDDTSVVAYADQMGSGPYRLWWACRVYGHDTVRILDGGLDKWMHEGRTVSADPVAPRRARWTPKPSIEMVATSEDVAKAMESSELAVLDSRPPEQFRGEFVWFETRPVAVGPDGIARTPRGEIRAGHIPGARNIPYASLYRQDFTMKDPEELRGLLAAADVDGNAKAITYCGCGISASALLFALKRAGVDDAALYDASWEEWGRDPRRPVDR
jgi:thiosulfate/3-mercaptopyruvate sulfurtransferase